MLKKRQAHCEGCQAAKLCQMVLLTGGLAKARLRDGNDMCKGWLRRRGRLSFSCDLQLPAGFRSEVGSYYRTECNAFLQSWLLTNVALSTSVMRASEAFKL